MRISTMFHSESRGKNSFGNFPINQKRETTFLGKMEIKIFSSKQVYETTIPWFFIHTENLNTYFKKGFQSKTCFFYIHFNNEN